MLAIEHDICPAVRISSATPALSARIHSSITPSMRRLFPAALLLGLAMALPGGAEAKCAQRDQQVGSIEASAAHDTNQHHQENAAGDHHGVDDPISESRFNQLRDPTLRKENRDLTGKLIDANHKLEFLARQALLS